MSSWLEDLERSLEERLDAFLRANPDQTVLLEEQHHKDRQRTLLQRRREVQSDAKELRRQLIELAADVRDWTGRSHKARQAGAAELADRAHQHVQTLMDQGRQRWQELDSLGERFRTIEQELSQLANDNNKPSPGRSLDDDWALFEDEQELEDLRRQSGLS